MKKFGIFLCKFVLGVVLAWLCAVLCQCFFQLRLSFSDRERMIWCVAGSAVASLFFMKFKLIPVYVFGHELTHWAVAKLFLRRTSKFTVHFSHGSVRVERPNIWIVLGPYILPIYMLLFLLVSQLLQLMMPFSRDVQLGCSAAVGILYAYHLVLTIVALSQNQPDLKISGPCFSFIFIIFFNLLFLYLGIALAGNNLRHALELAWCIIQNHAHTCQRTISGWL